jgi:hypothetical protein
MMTTVTFRREEKVEGERWRREEERRGGRPP